MHTIRKFALVATAAGIVMALAAPVASGQEPLSHTQSPDLTATAESTGAPCPAVSPSPAPSPAPLSISGGCLIHGSGANIFLVAHVFGIESVDSTCNWEFNGRLDSSGEGYLSHVEMTQGTAGTCSRRPCGSSMHPEGRAWSIYGRETIPGTRQLTLLFCTWQTGHMTNTHCEVSVPFTEPTNHRYTITANDSACHGVAGSRGELSGTWNLETALNLGFEGFPQHVEINHTSPGS